MEQEKSDDRVNMLLGKKENPALSKMLGKKVSEESLLGKTDKGNALDRMLGKEHKRSKFEEDLTSDNDMSCISEKDLLKKKAVKCPKCSHEFLVE